MKTLIVAVLVAAVGLTMAIAAYPSDCALKGTPACPEYPACCKK
jgi:hypothetical protein